ncbi:transmembrane protein, putative [Bodo saltans]|uniref:Transmembrane protein, putative n=1 Tax=Bodo saltans TaxID=75058 RepID=A0A0S4JNH1_BODSA|nr:transmembrane protein, putative [Bodo saltans]|eukprot:CUG90937.1 transmembrane protein, putative [Bodo saltans]
MPAQVSSGAAKKRRAGETESAAQQQQQQSQTQPQLQQPISGGAAARAKTSSSIALASLRLFALSFMCLVFAVVRKQFHLPFVALEGMIPLVLFVVADRDASSQKYRSPSALRAQGVAAFDVHHQAQQQLQFSKQQQLQQHLRRQAQWVELVIVTGGVYLFLDNYALEQAVAIVLAINAVHWALRSLIPSVLSVSFTWMCYQFVDDTSFAAPSSESHSASSSTSSGLPSGLIDRLVTMSMASLQQHSSGIATAATTVLQSGNIAPSAQQHLRSLGIAYEPPRWVTAVCLALSIQLLFNTGHILAQYRSSLLLGLAEYLEEFSAYVSHRLTVWTTPTSKKIHVAAGHNNKQKQQVATETDPQSTTSSSSSLTTSILAAVSDFLDSTTYFVSPTSLLGFVLWYALMAVDWYAQFSLGGALLAAFTVLAIPQHAAGQSGGRRGSSSGVGSPTTSTAAGASSTTKSSTPVMGFLTVVVALDCVIYLIVSPRAVCMVANAVLSAFAILYFWNHSRVSSFSSSATITTQRHAFPLAVVWIGMVGSDLWVQLDNTFHVLLRTSTSTTDAISYPYLGAAGISGGDVPGGIAGVTVAILAALVAEAETPSPFRHLVAVHTIGFGMYLLYSAFVETSRATMLAEQELKILTFLAQPPQPASQQAISSSSLDPQGQHDDHHFNQEAATNHHEVPALAQQQSRGRQSTATTGSHHSSRGVSPLIPVVVENESHISATESEASLASSSNAAQHGGMATEKQQKKKGSASRTAANQLAVDSSISAANPLTAGMRNDDDVNASATSAAVATKENELQSSPGASSANGDAVIISSSSTQPSTQPSRDVTPLDEMHLVVTTGKASNPASQTTTSKKATKKKEMPPQSVDAVEPTSPVDDASVRSDPSPDIKISTGKTPNTSNKVESKATRSLALEAPVARHNTHSEDKPAATLRRVVAPPQAIAHEHLDEGVTLEASAIPSAPSTTKTSAPNSKQSTAVHTKSGATNKPAATPVAVNASKHQATSSAATPAPSSAAVNINTTKLSFGDVVRGAKAIPPAAAAASPSSSQNAQGPLSVDGPEMQASSSSAVVTGAKGKQAVADSKSAAAVGGVRYSMSIGSIDGPEGDESLGTQPSSSQRRIADRLHQDGFSQRGDTPLGQLTSPTTLTKASKTIKSIDDDDADDDDDGNVGPQSLGSASNPIVPPSPLSEKPTPTSLPPPISPQRSSKDSQSNKNEKNRKEIQPIALSAPLSPGGRRGGGDDSNSAAIPATSGFDHFGGMRLGTSPLIRERGPMPTVTGSYDMTSALMSELTGGAPPPPPLPTSAATDNSALDLAMFHFALTGGSIDEGAASVQPFSTPAVTNNSNNNPFHPASDVGGGAFPDDDVTGADSSSTVYNIDSMISQLASAGNSPLPSDAPAFPTSQARQTTTGSIPHRPSTQFLTLEELTKAVHATTTPPTLSDPSSQQPFHPSGNGDDGAASTASGASSTAWGVPTSAAPQQHTAASDAQYEALSQGFLLNLLDDDQPTAQQHHMNTNIQQNSYTNMGGLHGGGGFSVVGSNGVPMAPPSAPSYGATMMMQQPQPQIYQVGPNGGVVPVPGSGPSGSAVSQVVMTTQGPYAVVTLSNGQQIMCPVVYQQNPAPVM